MMILIPHEVNLVLILYFVLCSAYGVCHYTFRVMIRHYALLQGHCVFL